MNEQTISVAEAKKTFSELLIIRHLGAVKGWLDENDSFFETINNIVENRKGHAPRIIRRKKGK
jgi:hypothetical protein